VLVNEGEIDCTFIAVGRKSETACHYPDIDMYLPANGHFVRKDGSDF
jgi:uncharacterized cupin superfamily protein